MPDVLVTGLTPIGSSETDAAEHDASSVSLKRVGNYVWNPDTLTWIRAVGDASGSTQVVPTANFILSLDYDGSGNLIYLGKAVPGSTAAQAVWQIRKLAYDGSNNLTSMLIADGNDDFDNVWNNRASLSYS